MWKCPRCGTDIEEEGFDTCWNCLYTEGDDLAFPDDVDGKAHPTQIKCQFCKSALEYVGVKGFHEGARLGVLGGMGETFVNTEDFDMWVCPACGNAEFFLRDVGDVFRPIRY